MQTTPIQNTPAQTIVIIGGGHAAAQLITSFRMGKYGTDGEKGKAQITLISDEPLLPYQRPPLSKAYLKGDMTADRLPILRETAFDAVSARCILGCRAERIDTVSRHVYLKDGRSLPYDTLILATGGRARPLACPGGQHERVFTVRTKSDIDRLMPHFHAANHIGVVGGGYIGLEAASVARESGKKVTLFEADARLLARAVSPQVSAYFHQLHTGRGVSIHYDAFVDAVQDSGAGGLHISSRHSSSGQTEETSVDILLVGIGMLPNMELAVDAGLETDTYGITVNNQCQTSDPHIYAVGDVTSFHHPLYSRQMRLESVPNAVDQAKVAAENIMGNTVSYDSLPWFWSDQYGLRFQSAGLSAGADEIATRGTPAANSVAFFALKDGRLIAADCVNRVQEFMLAKKLIAAGAPITKGQLTDETRPFKEIAADALLAASPAS